MIIFNHTMLKPDLEIKKSNEYVLPIKKVILLLRVTVYNSETIHVKYYYACWLELFSVNLHIIPRISPKFEYWITESDIIDKRSLRY